MKKDKINQAKGFTLIELLVVIAIIAILSTVVMAGLNSARAKGRDAKRLADIKAVQSALELCSDSGGGYPIHADAILATSLGDADACGTGVAFTTYMNPLPVNPLPGGADYHYSSADAKTYAVTFNLEGASGSLPLGNHTATPSGIQ